MIKVEIVTPKGLAFSKEVESVNVPTAEGEVGILENHMYMLTLLKPGLVYFNGNDRDGIAVTYGIVDITPKKVIILSEEAYEIGEIDVGKAKQEFEEAIKKLATAQTLEEVAEWERIKEKAQALMTVASKK